jgi:hypothetical protein
MARESTTRDESSSIDGRGQIEAQQLHLFGVRN